MTPTEEVGVISPIWAVNGELHHQSDSIKLLFSEGFPYIVEESTRVTSATRKLPTKPFLPTGQVFLLLSHDLSATPESLVCRLGVR